MYNSSIQISPPQIKITITNNNSTKSSTNMIKSKCVIRHLSERLVSVGVKGSDNGDALEDGGSAIPRG